MAIREGRMKKGFSVTECFFAPPMIFINLLIILREKMYRSARSPSGALSSLSIVIFPRPVSFLFVHPTIIAEKLYRGVRSS